MRPAGTARTGETPRGAHVRPLGAHVAPAATTVGRHSGTPRPVTRPPGTFLVLVAALVFSLATGSAVTLARAAGSGTTGPGPSEPGAALVAPDLAAADPSTDPSAALGPDPAAAGSTAPAPAGPAPGEPSLPAASGPSPAPVDPPPSPGTSPPAPPDPAAPDPAPTDPAATDPAATDPAATDPAATDPAATDTATPDPSGSPTVSLPPGTVGPDGGRVVQGPVTVVLLPGSVAAPTLVTVDLAPARVPRPPAGPAPSLSFAVAATDADTGDAVTVFAAAATVAVDVPVSPGGPDLVLAVLVPDGTWSALPTTVTPDGLTAPIAGPGTFAVLRAAQLGAPAGEVRVDSVALALVTDSPSGSVAQYLAPGQPLTGLTPFDTLRVRWVVSNTGPDSQIRPRLLFRAATDPDPQPVPREPQLGVALYRVQEWVPTWNENGQGTRPAAEEEPLPVSEFRLPEHTAARPVEGHHDQGGPLRAVLLPSDSYTEVEFTVRVSFDAEYLAAYDLLLQDGPAALPGPAATLVLGPEPPVVLTPGQQQGSDETWSLPAPGSGGGGATASIRYALLTPGTVRAASPIAGPHGPYDSTVPDQCAFCHRAHSAQGPNLAASATSPSALCLACHDGTGATTDVQARYADPAVPANDPATRSYYRHDALASSGHTSDVDDEFGGRLERHSACGDCHNAHRATGTDSVQTTAGWTASGRVAGVSGVAVANGAAGSAPTYTRLDGVTAVPQLEYQLCFKCHSGYTTLPSNTGFTASKHALDKAVEFNPANASFHPVEAAGRNQTSAMASSLSGTSPYKRWNFSTTSTIRCLNCHADGAIAGSPPAGGSAPPHASANRGLLLAPYRDRVLTTRLVAYTAANFALCFLCHAEAPFRNNTSSGTNFRYHGLHMTELADNGSGGTNIDTAGGGQGNAVCAECHFRLHSTSYPAPGQTVDGSRLVNFSPNVIGTAGATWRPRSGTTSGSCTLTCHGKRHSGYSY